MAAAESRVIGRYALHGEIASGGMATVHLGRLLGQVGFSRTVAIKRLHPQFAKDPDFVSMFLDEARLATRIRHPNVVQTLDIETSGDELLLVLEFVLGESLARLIRAAYQASSAVPIPVALGILAGALDGLHAAHEARSEQGEPLGIVHRDVSPQNILVGADGVARVLDFGIAKATRKSEQTRSGMLKGKVAYMPPEQLKGGSIDRRTDVYAASVVLWEALTGYRLFDGEDDFQIANKILTEALPPPSQYRAEVPPALDAVVLQGLARDPKDRFPSALAMVTALETAGPLASSREISRWIERVAGTSLRHRSELITEVESGPELAAQQRPSLLQVPVSIPRPPAPQGAPRSSMLQQPTSSSAPVPRPSFLSTRPSLAPQPSAPRPPGPQPLAPQSPGPQSPGPQSPGPAIAARPSFLRAPNEPPPRRPSPSILQGSAPVPAPPPAPRAPQPGPPPIPAPPSLLRAAPSVLLAPPTQEQVTASASGGAAREGSEETSTPALMEVAAAAPAEAATRLAGVAEPLSSAPLPPPVPPASLQDAPHVPLEPPTIPAPPLEALPEPREETTQNATLADLPWRSGEETTENARDVPREVEAPGKAREDAAGRVEPLAPEETVAQMPLAELLAANAPGGPEPGASSQISSISIVRSSPSQRPAWPARRWAIAAGVVLLVGMGGFLLRGEPPRATAEPSPAPSASEVLPETSASPPPSASETAIPPASAPLEAPAASASVEPPDTHPADPPKKAPKGPSVPAPKKNNCSPPYTIDKKGIKRIKPECT